MRNRSGAMNNSAENRRCLRSRHESINAGSGGGDNDDAATNDRNDEEGYDDVELRSLLSGGGSGNTSLPPLHPHHHSPQNHLITHLNTMASTTTSNIENTTTTSHQSRNSNTTNGNLPPSNNNSRRRAFGCISSSAMTLLLLLMAIILGISFLLVVDPMDHEHPNYFGHGDKHHHLSNYGDGIGSSGGGGGGGGGSVPYRMKDYKHNLNDWDEQQQPPPSQAKWNYWFGGKSTDKAPTTITNSNTGKMKYDRNYNLDTMNQKQRQHQQQHQQSGLTKIKEAIDNIDRIFMDNRPDAPVDDTAATGKVNAKKKSNNNKEKQKQKTRQNPGQGGGGAALSGGGGGSDDDSIDSSLGDSDRDGDGDNNMNNIIAIGGEDVPLVVDAEDDDALAANADALDAYARTLPASDALECRASVVAFVINATDVKDECDGLRKAFDKACSVQAQQQQQQPPEQRRTLQRRNMARRRVFSEWGRPHVSNLMPEAYQGYLQQWMKGLRSVAGNVARRLTIPTKVVEFSDGNNETKALRGEVQWRRLEGIFVEDEEEVEDGMMSDELNDESSSSTVQQQDKKQEQTGVVVAPPIISLNIPTENEHLSEQMLNDALLLQDTELMQATLPISVVDAPPDQFLTLQQQQQSPPLSSKSALSGDYAQSPANNVTVDTQVAVQDVAESAEAIRTAVEGVKKSMMNDPKSVEARTCCASILSVFHEHCDPTTKGVEDYSDQRLLVVVFVITVCGIIKSMIRHLNIRWLPEAGGCILVGVLGYLILQHMPHVRFAFDGDMFLRIMVPPIVFEAAVKINKQSFRRHVIPITIFAIVGTLASTAFTAFILHKGSNMFGGYVPTIPPRESLIFGALISSIDPIAVLSVLSNMGMTDTDTIYVLIFGESLLNDGVAIVLFQTLVHFLDESLVIDSDVVLDASIHFVVVALGSISVGIASGACATLYFSLMHGCQTPMVEVIMFCCWSFIPYYICDMVEWSGIVAIVANGFVMDLYVIGQTHKKQPQQPQLDAVASSTVESEIDFLVNGGTSNNINGTPSRRYNQQQCRSAFTYEGHLSPTADTHVHFVIEIFATLMETAIFAYLGLFLFSSRYHWNGYLTVLSIFATVMGRVLMIPILSHIANVLNRMRISRQRQRYPVGISNINDEVHIDRRMQLVLVFAGLRGAMSFALVEHIPMFDTTTGQGSRLKPELKAMTSASVIFTLFVLGGATSYLMERLGYSLNTQQGQQQNSVEIVSLLHNHEKRTPTAADRKSNDMFPQANDVGIRNNGKVRQRGSR